METIRTPPSNTQSRDGWERTFGQGIPRINDDVKEMLYGWLKSEPHKIIYFFMGHCDFSEDRAHYLYRELQRGLI